MKKLLIWLIIILAVLTGAVCVMATVTDDGFLPGFIGVGAYEVTSDEYPTVLPAGAMALVERKSGLEKGDLVIFESGGEDILGVVSSNGTDGLKILSGGREFRPAVAYVKGRVFYQIENIGRGAAALRQYKEIVWGVAGGLVLLGVLWRATLPSRRRRREVRELIRLFDEYGRRFDEEDEGIDY